MNDIPPVPFFTPEEEDYYVEQYRKQGFDYSELSPSGISRVHVGLQYYSFTVLYI